MSYMTPYSRQLSVRHPLVGEDSGYPPYDNLPGALQDSSTRAQRSTLEATGYDQYGQTGAPPLLDQMRQQPNSPPYGTGGHFTFQDAIMPENQRSRNVDGKVRPVCLDCNKSFGRDQELQRHMKDVHTSRRQCPFCHIMWTRPDKIKAHIIADHVTEFTPEMLEAIKALSGRRIVEFMDAFDHGLGAGPTFGSSSQFQGGSIVPIAPGTLPT